MATGMDGTAFLQKRSKRHMARMLEQFEALVAPHLPESARQDSERFKGIARETLKEFTKEAGDVIESVEAGYERNGAAIEIRDRLGASIT